MDQRPIMVYHLIDHDGTCVYVGTTKCPKRRDIEHRESSKMYERMVVVAGSLSKRDAHNAELAMIHDRKPKYNIAGVVRSRLYQVRERMGLV